MSTANKIPWGLLQGGGSCWCLELTDALLQHPLLSPPLADAFVKLLSEEDLLFFNALILIVVGQAGIYSQTVNVLLHFYLRGKPCRHTKSKASAYEYCS